MSDGLKSFAGDSLRKALLTFTRRPVTAFLSGMDLGKLSAETAAWRRAERPAILQEAAETGSDPAGLLRELDTLQWLDRLAYHFARIEAHLAGIEQESDPPPPA